MSDHDAETQTAVATAEPPAEPPAPPSTATAAPEPGRKRRGGCWLIALVVVALVVLGLGTWWLLARSSHAPAPSPATTTSAFDSAMAKAGVKSPGAPPSPVDLATVKTSGSHAFSATFTPAEISALANAFPHEVAVGNQSVALSNVQISATSGGGLSMSADVAAGGTSYSGTVSGNVGFEGGKVVADGPLTVEAQGFTLPDTQAQTATNLLLAYVNGYLSAAPGLTITAASVGPSGITVAGSAPDSISY